MPIDLRPDPEARLRAAIREAVASQMRAPQRMTLPEWADKYRRLSNSSGAIGGQWQTSRVEVARGPMMAVTEPGVRIITCMVCTQTLKTSLLENVLGYHAHLDPCPMLLVQPKDEAVDAFSKERLVPMVQASPVLRPIMGDQRSRRSEDTLKFKRFPGGFLAMASAGSPTNLAMRAIRITLLDEVDKYEVSKEGDPIALAEERMATFMTNSLSIRACSPTWEGGSRIAASYETSDQRRAYVDCPHCGYSQDLDFFRHVHWAKTKTGEGVAETAAIHCEHCGAAWSEVQRLRMLTPGHLKWFQTRRFECCGEDQDPRKLRQWAWDEEHQVGYAICVHCGERAVGNKHAGFTASKLYSPFTNVIDLVDAWLKCQRDPDKKQTFYNTQLALPFKTDALKEVNPHTLAERQEVWERVPNQVLAITAGVDVHPTANSSEGRLEVEVVGWGLGEESWSLAYEVFTGDPAKDEVWTALDDFLLKPLIRQDGRPMAIRAVCVDSGGHNTQEAYRYCQGRGARNIWAIKGANDRGNWSPIWPAVRKTKPGSQYRKGYRPIIIGVSAAKEAVRQRLLVKEPGPGYSHFPAGRQQAYFDQLTAEQLTVERRQGQLIRRWTIPSHRTNEAFDTRVYAYAALWGMYTVRRIRLESLHLAINQAPPPPVKAPRDTRMDAETSDRELERMTRENGRDKVPMAVAAGRVRKSTWLTR